MTTYVVDVSVLIASLLEQIALPDDLDVAACPHLVDIEYCSAMRKLVLRQEITEPTAAGAISEFGENDAILRFDHTGLLPRIWALRGGITAYDAAYVALAEALDLELLTLDTRLARAAEEHCRVRVLSSSV